MSDINELTARIDGAITSVKDKLKQQQQQELQSFQDRQRLLTEYERVRSQITEIAKPRLEALAKRAGERVSVTPTVSGNQRSVAFDFRSSKAYITLTFSVAPDREVKNAVVTQDLRIVPVLWNFTPHAEFSTPIAKPDLNALTKWLDDRIIAFVGLFIEIHENELLEKAEFVEDPVAKVKFPKFAAGATLDHNGQTHFFIDDSTKAEFAKQKGIA